MENAEPLRKKKLNPNDQLFLLGIKTILPALITVVLLVKAYQFINEILGAPINHLLRSSLVGLLHFQPADVEAWYPNVIGFLLAFSVFFLAGYFFAGYVGRRVFLLLEHGLAKLPVIRAVYPHAKQIVDFFTADKGPAVAGVVYFEYPRAGIYSIGFVTSEGMRDLSLQAGDQAIGIFLPSCPMPLGGFTMFVPKKDLIFADVSVDQVLRFMISGGALVPEVEKRAA